MSVNGRIVNVWPAVTGTSTFSTSWTLEQSSSVMVDGVPQLSKMAKTRSAGVVALGWRRTRRVPEDGAVY